MGGGSGDSAFGSDAGDSGCSSFMFSCFISIFISFFGLGLFFTGLVICRTGEDIADEVSIFWSSEVEWWVKGSFNSSLITGSVLGRVNVALICGFGCNTDWGSGLRMPLIPILECGVGGVSFGCGVRGLWFAGDSAYD